MEEQYREALSPLILESIRKAQDLIEFKDGIFFVDFLRIIRPFIKSLIERGMKIEYLTVDKTFTYVFVNEDAFYSNSDFTQFSVIELAGFKKWSQY